jgi:serralysin
VSSGSGRSGSVGSTTLNQFTTGMINVDSQQHPDPALNGQWWYVLLHEIGHILGLGHAGPYDGGNINTMTQQLGPYDAEQWTLMSYIRPEYVAQYSGQYAPAGTSWPNLWSTTWMPLDILAIQRLYGKPVSTPLSGGQTFGFNCNITDPIGSVFDFTKNTKPIITIWDAGKNNTLDLSGFSSAETVNLNPGAFSSVAGLTNNLAIAFDTEINTLICGSGDSTVICNDYGDTVRGGAGNDTLKGGSNVDTAVVAGNRSAYTVTQTATGVFQVVGPDGTDTLTSIEYLKFDDQTMHLLPGTGTTVDFNASPSAYMGAIRDFDGNDLGGATSWKLIGTADTNGDGQQEHILVNREIGRWAEVATAADGNIYFGDHGWAGTTRVVGIYVDPLVQQGTVIKDSATDSQRRFQNDLNIENIHNVLGQADYNHDGLQEIYFSLADGTAYLHAYMHADGNIQYANYQSKQQVIDYLSGAGWSASSYASWFPNAQAAPEVLTGNAPTILQDNTSAALAGAG